MKRYIFIALLICGALEINIPDDGSAAGQAGPQAPAPAPAGGTGGGTAAPGADALMTSDFLLVSPAGKGGTPPEPLQAFVGQSLKLNVESRGITLDGLQGMKVSASNDTNRPLVIDGDRTRAVAGSKSYECAPVSVVEKSVLPTTNPGKMAVEVFTKVAPAFATVGAIPTAKDIITARKPYNKRYGPDQARREAEASRFGKRIIWPHDKSEGIIYFKTSDSLAGAKLLIPVNTLFDTQDNAVITASPP